MKKHTRCPLSAPISPWLKPNASSLIHYELELAKENLPFPPFIPHDAFSWILKNKGEGLLLRSLDRVVPLFPVIAYQRSIALWMSPPPSGAGSVVGIIMGKDKTNTLRCVGSNYLNEPRLGGSGLPTAIDFFDQYDNGDRLARERLIYSTIRASITPEHAADKDFWTRACEAFNTMLVYLVALTNEGSLLGIGPAQVDGIRPADFSVEFMGEIK